MALFQATTLPTTMVRSPSKPIFQYSSTPVFLCSCLRPSLMALTYPRVLAFTTGIKIVSAEAARKPNSVPEPGYPCPDNDHSS